MDMEDEQKRQPQEEVQPPVQDSVGKALQRNLSISRISSLTQRALACVKERGWEALGREAQFRINLMLRRDVWKFRADIPLKREWQAQKKVQFAVRPQISILVPLYNTPPPFFDDMVRSVLRQSYAGWELVLVDASDAGNELKARAQAFQDDRIRYLRLEKNEGISGNTNYAIQAARGDWLALLDHDDMLQCNALYEIVNAINVHGADFVYSDEIVLDAELKNLVQYHFKADYCPEELQGCNYITHFSAFSRELLEKAGAYENAEYDGSQDYDLILRLTEKAECIYHVPKVLYYWRSHAGSTAGSIAQAKPYALEAGRRALEAHLERIGFPGTVEIQPDFPGTYRPSIHIKGQPYITVMIPNKDHICDLTRCLDTLYAHAGWPDFEVLIIENNSTEAETFAGYEKLREQHLNLRIVTYTGSFNYSAINNFGAQYASGTHLLLLNNDIEVTTDGFLRELLSYSQQPGIGAVGAKLLYPDHTIQHAGVIIGLGGTAGHSHKGLPAENGGDLNRLVTTQNYSAVTGACLMVKAETYRKAGGLDDKNFAIAFNDVDFCLRLVGMGLRNVFTPFAAGTHYESKSRGYDTSGANHERYEIERECFVTRYASWIKNGDPCYNPHFTYLYENYGYR